MGIEIGMGGSNRRPRAQQGDCEVASFQVKGWMVIPVAILLLAFLAYRTTSAKAAFSGPQGTALKNHLQGEYVGHAVPALETALNADDRASVARFAAQALQTTRIEFTDIGVKGTGEELVAKVTIAVDGGTPPDGKAVRYFLLRHRFDGWYVERETGAFQYYIKLF